MSNRKSKVVASHRLSAKARKAISEAQKKRWEKFRAEKKKQMRAGKQPKKMAASAG